MESLREASPYLGLGMQLGFSIVVFTGGGYLLDRWLGTIPWLTVGGALIGMVAMFAQVLRISNEMSRRSSHPKRPGEHQR